MPMSVCPRCGNTMKVSADAKKQDYSCRACSFQQQLTIKKKGANATTVSHRGKA